MPSSACSPHACTCYSPSRQDKTFETPDPTMPHSSLVSATITETCLHLYFLPFVSNQMHAGSDWSDMNLIRGWCHVRNPIKLSSSPNKLSPETKHLVMAWRTPVYIVFPAGFLNGLSSQKLSFILQTTDKKIFYLNTLLALIGVFLELFPTKINSLLRDSRQRNLNFPTTQSLNGLGAPALSISCLLCTSRAQQVLAGGARQLLQIPCSPSRHMSGNHLLSCT